MESDEEGDPVPENDTFPAEQAPQSQWEDSTSGHSDAVSEDEEVAMDIFEALEGGEGMGAMPPESIPDLPPELQCMHKAATTLMWENGCISQLSFTLLR